MGGERRGREGMRGRERRGKEGKGGGRRERRREGRGKAAFRLE